MSSLRLVYRVECSACERMEYTGDSQLKDAIKTLQERGWVTYHKVLCPDCASLLKSMIKKASRV